MNGVHSRAARGARLLLILWGFLGVASGCQSSGAVPDVVAFETTGDLDFSHVTITTTEDHVHIREPSPSEKAPGWVQLFIWSCMFTFAGATVAVIREDPKLWYTWLILVPLVVVLWVVMLNSWWVTSTIDVERAAAEAVIREEGLWSESSARVSLTRAHLSIRWLNYENPQEGSYNFGLRTPEGEHRLFSLHGFSDDAPVYLQFGAILAMRLGVSAPTGIQCGKNIPEHIRAKVCRQGEGSPRPAR